VPLSRESDRKHLLRTAASPLPRRADTAYAPRRTSGYAPACGELRGFSADQRTRPRRDASAAT